MVLDTYLFPREMRENFDAWRELGVDGRNGGWIVGYDGAQLWVIRLQMRLQDQGGCIAIC